MSTQKNRILILVAVFVAALAATNGSAADPGSNTGSRASNANGLMYYNAVANQQKTNVFGMKMTSHALAAVEDQSELIRGALLDVQGEAWKLMAAQEKLIGLLDGADPKDASVIDPHLKSVQSALRMTNEVESALTEAIGTREPDHLLLHAPAARASVCELSVEAQIAAVEGVARKVQEQLEKMKSSDQISIGDMFEMQMLVNQLAQTSELTSSVLSAAHSAISSLAAM